MTKNGRQHQLRVAIDLIFILKYLFTYYSGEIIWRKQKSFADPAI